MIRAWRQSPTKHAPKSDRGEPDNDRGLKVIAPLFGESDTSNAPIGALGVFLMENPMLENQSTSTDNQSQHPLLEHRRKIKRRLWILINTVCGAGLILLLIQLAFHGVPVAEKGLLVAVLGYGLSYSTNKKREYSKNKDKDTQNSP